MIRRAIITDIPCLIDLLSEVAMVHHRLRPDLFKPNTTKYAEHELATIIADEQSPIFVYDEEGIKAYAFCRIQEMKDDRLLQDRKTLYIDDLCVTEHSRGRHIGSKLFAYVREYAQTIECDAITLNVWEGNEAAMHFYRSIGMAVQKTGMEMAL